MRKKEVIKIIVIVLILFSIILIFKQSKDFEVNLNSLSIIEGQIGVSDIDFTITVENKGNIDLLCYPSSASPSVFNSALDKTTKVVPSTGTKKASWTSTKINLLQFEGPPLIDSFEVTIQCSYSDGQIIHDLPIKKSYLNLTIEPEQRLVNFRTSDLSYPAIAGVSIIAFAEQCIPTLILYKEKTRSCWTTTSPSCPSRSGYTLLKSNIPGAPIGSTGNLGCLYKDYSDYTNLVIAWKTKSSGGTCGVIGQWQTITFDLKLSSQNEISNSWVSINLLNEIMCY